MPVVASVGVDADGQSYNINADTVAGRLAAALGARKAIFLTDVEGIFRDVSDPASLISECRLRRPARPDGLGRGRRGDDPQARRPWSTPSSRGSAAAHIVDGRVPHSVLIEIFTETGVGTKVTA